ncbi:hypothetical protein ACVWZN_001555 [Lysobacter sp. HA35]
MQRAAPELLTGKIGFPFVPERWEDSTKLFK